MPDADSGRTGTLAVVNKAEHTVWLLDAATGERRASLPTGHEPHEAAASPDGRTLVVTDYGGVSSGRTLTVVDVAESRVVRTIELGRYRRPHGVAWLPDGRRVAVTCEMDRAVVVVDVEAGEVEAALPTLQEGTHMLAVSPDGGRVYTTNVASGTVTALDVERRAVAGGGRPGREPEGFALSPDGAELWVGNRGEHTVSVMDARTLQTVATLPAPGLPFRLAFTPDGREALVTCPYGGVLRVFDAAARRESAALPLGYDAPVEGWRPGISAPSAPLGLTVGGGGRYVFATSASAPVVTVVDLPARRVVGYLRGGHGADGVAWSPVPAREGAS